MDFFFFFQAEDGIRDLVRSRGLGDVYERRLFVASKTGRIALIQVSEYQDIPIHPNKAFIFAGYVAGAAFTTSIPLS